MKKKLVILFIAVLAFTGAGAGSAAANAAVDRTSTNISITTVPDINVYDAYVTNSIPIDTILYNEQSGDYLYKVNLESDGFISLLLSANDLVKSTTVYGTNKAGTTTSQGVLSATIYRDQMMLYPVTQTITTGNKGSVTTNQKIALDKGTYYIDIKTDKYVYSTNGSATTMTSVKGTGLFILYYQQVNTDEQYRPSKVGMENLISIDREFNGMLTVTNPKDYYVFAISDKALVRINILYGSTNNAKFVLYGTDREVLAAKTVSGNNVRSSVEKFLEPGTYYCSLEPVTAADGGQTNLMISQTVYPLKLTQVNSTVNSYVKVNTIETPKEIRYVKGKLTNSELTSVKWNKSKVITDTLSFGVNMTGYYTVRVTDEYGNMFMQSINVNYCDKKAPGKPTVKTYKRGTYIVAGTAEKNSIVTVGIGGRLYTCTASSKGNYKCELPFQLAKGNKLEVTAQDMSGNSSTKAQATVS